jgi:hypothetical protein
MDPLTPNPLPEQLAAQAEFIVNNFQQSDYQYDANIDVADGIYDCDCSVFVSLVLQEVAPDHYDLFSAGATQPWPLAYQYYDFFAGLTPESAGGWHAIDFLPDARRGDIIAWRASEIEPGKDTGHVFFVAGEPTVLDSGALAVQVYDSAAYPHFEDTRGAGASGVGSGFVNFQVDENGVPIAFQFGPSDPIVSLPIAIGA